MKVTKTEVAFSAVVPGFSPEVLATAIAKEKSLQDHDRDVR